MRFAVAIVSPPNFQHSKAFDEVAEGLHLALLALGHDSVLTNRLDFDERRTIVLGGNLLVRYGLEPPKNPIFYNLEQLGDDLPSMTLPAFFDLFRRYPTWDYSQANIERLAVMGLPRPTYVPIGYVPELTRIAPAAEDIDVLFYGASYERRYAVLRDLHDRGLRVKWLSGVYGVSRDAWIARSKIVLNIHYWEAKIFEITRVSYLLANRRAVVSERGADPALERDAGVRRRVRRLRRTGRSLCGAPRRRARATRARRARLSGFLRSQPDRHSASRAGRPRGCHPQDRCAGRPVASMCASTAKTTAHDHRLRERRLFRHKFAPDRDLWLAKVERNPEDARSVFFLAETSFQMDDFVDARRWYARRVEMGGCDEEVYWAMYRLAESMVELGEPWPDVQETYLKAWEFRPTRAEALYAIAFRCRVMQRYWLGYLFAQRAAETPFPEEDLFVIGYYAEIYAWRATDEQATSAFWIGKHAEAFELYRRLLARPDLPEPDRQRIATNRDFSVPAMLEAAAPYPDALVQSLCAGPGAADVTVSLVAGPDRHTTEQTLNSFLNCCLDVSRVKRFLVLDTGLSAPDRAKLLQRYGFVKFARSVLTDKPAAQLAQLRARVDGRLWLHLGEGWRFFAPENLISRLTAVLDTEPQVFQVGINFADAVKLTGATAAEEAVRRAPDAGRYLLTEAIAAGPAMFDTTRLDRAIGGQISDPDPGRPPAARLRTASLDEVLCISGMPGRG